jgi:hypothetical protein
MNIDFGTAVVVAAALFFYLRLIIIQRQKVKQAPAPSQGKGKKGPKQLAPPSLSQYSILSRKPLDWIIAGIGAVAVLFGLLLKAGVLSLPGIAPYWWLPTALGIVACSWGFR